MTKRQLIGLLAFSGLAAVISCDSASSGTSGGLDASDCPVGMFRPVGLPDCVFPSVDTNNQPVGVPDNRCAQGQPAVPPQCISEIGERSYLASSMSCAPNYRYVPGACNRNGGGFPGGIVGAAGTTGGGTGFAGGFGGDSGTGFGGIGGVGAAGSPFAGASGAAGDPVTGGAGEISEAGTPPDGGESDAPGADSAD